VGQSAAPPAGPGAADTAPDGACAGSVAAGEAGPDPLQAASARAAVAIAEAAAAGARCHERIPAILPPDRLCPGPSVQLTGTTSQFLPRQVTA
jgi:hypothetical protein